MTNQEKGLEFEKQCYRKLEELNFKELYLTKNTDNGADIIGTHNGTKYVFQCKSHKKKQGNSCVQEVVASRALYKGNRCVVISQSSFTAQAIALAKENNCILIVASDFFQLSEFPPKDYSAIFKENTLVYNFDYQLIERYEEMKKVIGRIPKWKELDANIQYLIKKDYKNYGNFLSSIGDRKFTCKHTDEELRDEYIRIRKLINKVPTLTDIKSHSIFPLNQFHAYPLTKLQRECGDRPNVERGVTKDDLKNAYFTLEKELGHPPTINEIDENGKYRASLYRSRWGNFDCFLEEIGRTRTEAGLSRRYSKEEIILIYSIIKMLFSIVDECDSFNVNHTVLEHLTYYGSNVISPSTISKRFGGWENFMEEFENADTNQRIKEFVKQLRNDLHEIIL